MKYKYYILATTVSFISVITIMKIYNMSTNSSILILSIMFLSIANWFLWTLANTATIEDHLKNGDCMIVDGGDGGEIYSDINVEFAKDYVNIKFENGYVTLPNKIIEDIYKEIQEIQKGGD